MVNKANDQGPGIKVSLYIPPDDFSVIEEVDKLVKTLRDVGFRPSRSSEVIRLLKAGLSLPDERLKLLRAKK